MFERRLDPSMTRNTDKIVNQFAEELAKNI